MAQYEIGHDRIRAGSPIWHTGRGKEPRLEFLKDDFRPGGLKDTTSHKGLIVYRSCGHNIICLPENVKTVPTIVIDPRHGFAG